MDLSDPKTVQEILFVTGFLVLLVLLVSAVLLLLRLAARPRWFLMDASATGANSLGSGHRVSLHTGPACSYCGVLLPKEPVREVALQEDSLLVFACPDCRKETYLASSDYE